MDSEGAANADTVSAIPKGFQNIKFSSFRQRHGLSTSFGIFIVTYRVTNVLPKQVDIPLFFFCRKKLNFHFLKSYFSILPIVSNFDLCPLGKNRYINPEQTSRLILRRAFGRHLIISNSEVWSPLTNNPHPCHVGKY